MHNVFVYNELCDDYFRRLLIGECEFKTHSFINFKKVKDDSYKVNIKKTIGESVKGKILSITEKQLGIIDLWMRSPEQFRRWNDKEFIYYNRFCAKKYANMEEPLYENIDDTILYLCSQKQMYSEIMSFIMRFNYYVD